MEKVVIQLLDFPKVSTQQYDKVMADLRAKGQADPNGRLYHAAAAKPDGSLMVVNVWESERHFQEFSKILFPLLAKHGIPQAKPTTYPVHNEIVGRHEPVV